MTTSSNASHAHASKSASPGAEVKDTLASLGETVRDEVRRELDHVIDRADEVVEKGKAKARELRESVSDSLREDPLKAMLIAGGVGLLIGLYFGRQRGR